MGARLSRSHGCWRFRPTNHIAYFGTNVVTSIALTKAEDTRVSDVHMSADWRDLLALTKPRVLTLVVFTGLCGLLVAPGNLHPVLAFTAILCITLGAGAAGALNQWYEVDRDAKMKRTAGRPLPSGRMGRQTALHFGVGVGTFSVLLMGLATNWLAAAILSVSILFYVIVYTMWLKPRTAQNIVIGGAAGAFPPLIGWRRLRGMSLPCRLRSLRSSSFGLRRISGRCLCSFGWTTPMRASRCSLSSLVKSRPGGRFCPTRRSWVWPLWLRSCWS